MFDSYYNMVDRMNQDYHMHYQLRGFRNANSFALHSVVFYNLLTVRSLWEEHRVAFRFHHSGGSKQAALDIRPLSIPQFVLECARALDPIK